ncbi:microsomal triacylglycerol transfer protein isoform X2 [Ischnura elegans]|uniref:microsomal triacylglycerol transfer protein isoform X2 n=1 Tax=Ischnura elegans TaxID=197161 RepID=UPI001ED8AB6A|nr:microsomal triacylglycerol transfer protein isoform X2 [Ischnura elegans]
MDIIGRFPFLVCGLLAVFASSTRQYDAGRRLTYEYETTVLINEAGFNRKDVGFRITAELGVSVVWQSPVDSTDKLMFFEVLSPKLHIKSRKAPAPEGFVSHASKLDEFVNSPFLLHWKDGIISSIYLDEKEQVSLANLKRGMASLFQARPSNVESVENDASGQCLVSYKTDDSNIFEKNKSSCVIARDFSIKNPDNITGVDVFSKRESRFSFAGTEDRILSKVGTSEVVEVKSRLMQDVGGKVISKQSMKLSGQSDSSANLVKAGDISVAVLELGRNQQINFMKSSLEVVPENPTCVDNCPTLPKMVNEHRKSLETENIGRIRSASSFIKLLNIARQSTKDQMSKVLKSEKNKRILPQLIDLVAATQTMESHEAAMKAIHFESEDSLDLAERYLWTLSVGSNPQEAVILDLLKRANRNIENPKLVETLTLTMAAMAKQFSKRHLNEKNEVIEKIKAFIVDGLSDCENDQCRVKHLRALKNLKLKSTVPIIMDYACTGTKVTSVAAMKALRDMPKEFWNEDVIKAAEKIFYQVDKKYDSSSRTMAVDIILESGPSKSTMARLFWFIANVENRRGSATEACHYALQRMKQLYDSPGSFGSAFRSAHDSAIKELQLFNYHALSHKGLASALSWPFLESASSNGSLISILEIASGILKQGAIDIVLEREEEVKKMFTLGLFAGGLGAFISTEDGDDGDEGEEEEYANAGMELGVMGVQLRPFMFFSGQGELMGHVWSGTASERTPALQMIVLIQDHYESIPLQNGFIASINIQGAVSFDLAGQIQLSMWNRNAQSVVEKNGGVSMQGLLKVDSSFVRSHIETSLSTEAQLNLISNLDFSGNTLLCLQLKQPDVIIRLNTHKVERIIGSKHKLRKSIYKVNTIPGTTYALNRKNNENCNLLLSAD